MPDIKINIAESLSGTDEVLLYTPLVAIEDEETTEYPDGDEYFARPDYLSLSQLLICNTDSTDIVVSLYLESSSGNLFQFLRSQVIPHLVTLDFINGNPIEFDVDMKLVIKLGDAGHIANVTGMINGTMKYNN